MVWLLAILLHSLLSVLFKILEILEMVYLLTYTNYNYIHICTQSADSTVSSFEDSSVQLREDFETEDNNRATQLYLHKFELFSVPECSNSNERAMQNVSILTNLTYFTAISDQMLLVLPLGVFCS